MSLKYEPASEPLHISASGINQRAIPGPGERKTLITPGMAVVPRVVTSPDGDDSISSNATQARSLNEPPKALDENLLPPLGR